VECLLRCGNRQLPHHLAQGFSGSDLNRVYTRDVTLGEDRSRIRTNPGVFARLRSFAFNILKANQTDTLSQDRYRAGLAGITKLLRMLAVS